MPGRFSARSRGRCSGGSWRGVRRRGRTAEVHLLSRNAPGEQGQSVSPACRGIEVVLAGECASRDSLHHFALDVLVTPESVPDLPERER